VVRRLRVAFGTGAVLGLWDGKQEVRPMTAHLMIQGNGRCAANCRFCPQAREAHGDPSKLSRVAWPECDEEILFERIGEGGFRRICVQTVNYHDFFADLIELVEEMSRITSTPISVCTHPLEEEQMRALRRSGAERVCVPLDCASPEIFARVKGPDYRWDEHMRSLTGARAIFGRATTHLIVGLGETELEAARAIQRLHDAGVDIGLFAFFPVRGTPLEKRDPPHVGSYRRVQLARYLICEGMVRFGEMEFADGKVVGFGLTREELDRVVRSGRPFMTSGCPDCNRPFFNESPRGPIYNYPRQPTPTEIEEIRKEIGVGGE
jgi:biotin synthase-related radical SAM superfamily protein